MSDICAPWAGVDVFVVGGGVQLQCVETQR